MSNMGETEKKMSLKNQEIYEDCCAKGIKGKQTSKPILFISVLVEEQQISFTSS